MSASYWPAAVPPEQGRIVPEVVAATAHRLATGALRLVWWWPGLVATVVAYAAVAAGLTGEAYPNLWGALAATVVAALWYASPLRSAEARRRQRLRGPQAGGPGPAGAGAIPADS